MKTCEPAARACALLWLAGVRARAAAPGVLRKSVAVWALGLACALLALATVPAVSRASQVEKFPEGTIVKIEFEGTTIPADKLKSKLLSRVGHALSHEKAEADLKTLLGTKSFSNATYWVDE
jgi:outer membrane protein assembly factor BamA